MTAWGSHGLIDSISKRSTDDSTADNTITDGDTTDDTAADGCNATYTDNDATAKDSVTGANEEEAELALLLLQGSRGDEADTDDFHTALNNCMFTKVKELLSTAWL